MASIWKIWIDTGGTFTDCIAISPSGRKTQLKVLSSSRLRCSVASVLNNRQIKISHHWPVNTNIFSGYSVSFLNSDYFGQIISFDPDRSIIGISPPLPDNPEGDNELEIISEEEVPVLAARVLTQTPLSETLPPIHLRLGSTKGTNALLERKGAKVAFIVTKGFKDLVVIGDQQRPDLFTLNIQKPAPYYSGVFEINERLDAKGNELETLDDDELDHLIGELKNNSFEAIAVALLHAYVNPSHEIQLKEKLKNAGFGFVSISSELSNAIKILPRAETTIANAYLDPIIKTYVNNIRDVLTGTVFKIMSSSGGLVDADLFHPKNSLLSGPAGGLIGAAYQAKNSGFSKVLTLDMGGTSTDVSRFNDGFEYRYETKVGDARIMSPALSIETIAAGGGSICTFDGYRFSVGPESAGANPGPACYGTGGPLTITDVNLLAGRIDTTNFGIPVNVEAANQALEKIRKAIYNRYQKRYSKEEILIGFIQIANEKMAEAIKRISASKGFDPKEYALLAFGGAGGQHACSVAEILGIKKVIIPGDAGLLSAIGIGRASIVRLASRQILQLWSKIEKDVPLILSQLEQEVKNALNTEGFPDNEVVIRNRYFYLRFDGQEHTIEVDINQEPDLLSAFKNSYQALYGHWIDNKPIELESIKVTGSNQEPVEKEESIQYEQYFPTHSGKLESFVGRKWKDIFVYDSNKLTAGASIKGPAIAASRTSTTFIDEGWEMVIDVHKNAILSRTIVEKDGNIGQPKEALIELFSNRFTAVAEEMGAILQRTSFSVNIRERLDFSCAVLDAEGYLVVNAPHIPVHLGSLGMCVRKIKEEIEITDGDVIITNHPGYGGSHLPDITLIAPVFEDGKLVGFVANRAHHAEVGGTRPGSMPPDAKSLEEEGVVIPPMYLIRKNIPHWNRIKKLFTEVRYPTRALAENMADLNGALASVNYGVQAMNSLVKKYSFQVVQEFMNEIKQYANQAILAALKKDERRFHAIEKLDNGEQLEVKINIGSEGILFDFEGTSPQLSTNFNATPAITMSALLYVLRLLSSKPIPLNEGLIESVSIHLPSCMLNPDFSGDPGECPPVVGGNTETSQRLVDTLLKAFGFAACSQGTMNNLLFGNDDFGYYETICGGVGATNGHNGASAVHQHMTNTRITDPEILELRYPVRLLEFVIRENSGGKGKWTGGNGVIRRMMFTDSVELTLLSQHRIVPPYGMDGGETGKPGEQWIERKDGAIVKLEGIDTYAIKNGDTFVIQTPGGGGFGDGN